MSTRTFFLSTATRPTAAPPVTPAQRAHRAMDAIESGNVYWNQGSWTYCFAGRVVKQSGRNPESMLAVDIRDTAMCMLDLDDRRANRLFSATNSKRRLRRLVRRYFGRVAK